MDIEKVKIGKNAPEEFNVLVEIPKGSHNKYEYDEKQNILKLDRILYSPFYYPTDYGLIPETHSKDGDHLDCMIVTQCPVFPGCVVKVRAVGLLEMSDEEGIDNKILAVPVENPYYKDINELEDVPPHLLKEITHFFDQYKRLEKGKETKVEGWKSKEDAIKVIKECQERYENK